MIAILLLTKLKNGNYLRVPVFRQEIVIFSTVEVKILEVTQGVIRKFSQKQAGKGHFMAKMVYP